MTTDNPFIDEAEVAALAARWGQPVRPSVSLEVGRAFWGPWERKWPYRRGEVMFLLPRPGGLLLHRKRHYPQKAWRLLTGGIELSEAVADALAREPVEEVGLALGVQRYVALLDYDVWSGGVRYPWATHIFLMEYSDAPLNPSHDDEIEETQIVTLDGLAQTAADLSNLPDGRWRDWGRFRALAHTLVRTQVRPEEIKQA